MLGWTNIRVPVTVAQDRTVVDALRAAPAADLVVPNASDLTWATVSLDARSIEAVSTALAALPDAVDLAGRLTLPEAAGCLRRCAVFVGNDSGLMHLAAAAGAPTLGLFGPTPASEYAPAGPRAAAVLDDPALAARLSAAGRARFEAEHRAAPVLQRWRGALARMEQA